MRCARFRAAALVLLMTLVGCGGFKVQQVAYGDRIGWPPGDPRVRLDSVIDLHRGPQRRRPGSLAGTRTLTGAPGFNRPYAVAWSGDDLLVSDADTGRVARIDANGKVTFSPGQMFTRPVGVAACAAGILVTDAVEGTVSVLGPDLNRVGFLAEDLNRPTGIACTDTEIYVVETGNHHVLVYAAGRPSRSLGARGSEPGRFNYPTSVATFPGASAGSILVGDAMNFRVQLVDPTDGSHRHQFGQLGDAQGEMPRIKGVVVDARNHVWVTDAHLDQVSLYDQEGNLLISIGKSGSEPGDFSFPAGVAAHPDGRVAVVDSYNRRIQILRVEDER